MHKRSLGLAGEIIPRTQQRLINQRCEERYTNVIARAVVSFRGEAHLVTVLNISTRGTMIEAELLPRIGEAMIVEFENCTRIHAFVRWVRGGRIGLNFGHEIILG